MTDKLQSSKEALVLALQLAITAPTLELSRDCIKRAETLSAGMTEKEIEACKALAKANLDNHKR